MTSATRSVARVGCEGVVPIPLPLQKAKNHHQTLFNLFDGSSYSCFAAGDKRLSPCLAVPQSWRRDGKGKGMGSVWDAVGKELREMGAFSRAVHRGLAQSAALRPPG